VVAVSLKKKGLVQSLRHSWKVEYPLTQAKSDKQFKRALELNATFTAKLDRAEAGQTAVKLRNLKTRQETTVANFEDADQFLSRPEGDLSPEGRADASPA